MIIIEDSELMENVTPYELNCLLDIYTILMKVHAGDTKQLIEPNTHKDYPYSGLSKDKSLGKSPEDPPNDDNWYVKTDGII